MKTFREFSLEAGYADPFADVNDFNARLDTYREYVLREGELSPQFVSMAVCFGALADERLKFDLFMRMFDILDVDRFNEADIFFLSKMRPANCNYRLSDKLFTVFWKMLQR